MFDQSLMMLACNEAGSEIRAHPQPPTTHAKQALSFFWCCRWGDERMKRWNPCFTYQPQDHHPVVDQTVPLPMMILVLRLARSRIKRFES